MEFSQTKDLLSLAQFKEFGNELYDGLNVICEKNKRTPLINGILRSWSIGSVKMDLTGFGKYAESSCIVEINGINQSWPFTMLYVKKWD